MTIKIEVKSSHKSIEPGVLELPSLVIISGKNGSGKTHFLETVSNVSLAQFTDDTGNNYSIRKLVAIGQLEPVATDGNLGSPDYYFQQYNQFKQRRGPLGPDGNIPTFPEVITGSLRRTVERVMEYSGKAITELTLEDFRSHSAVDSSSMELDPFSQNVEAVFQRFADKRLENEIREFDENKGRDDGGYLPPHEFEEKFGNPIVEFNTLLQTAGFGYHFNEPPVPTAHDRIYRTGPAFELKLLDDLNGNEIQPSDLSSGEKVILSLVFALYNNRKDLQFPDVLLLDEPDAYLHPSMIRQFLQVLETNFVNRGMAVIMSTHSPTTVALAPEASLFEMERQLRWPAKVTKQQLLSTLLQGVPSVSVSYENRRQVFVESPNDVHFYETIYLRIRHLLEPEVSLSFISAGDSQADRNGQPTAGSNQVKKITDLLRNAGNDLVWGLIDWDCSNNEEGFVKVLGVGSRYSIENYLFDPLLVAALLLRSQILRSEDFGLDEFVTHFDLQTLASAKLQSVADFVIDTVRQVVGMEVDDASVSRQTLLCDSGVNIPDWYLRFQGHDLETAIIKAYPGLKRFTAKNGHGLKNEMVEKVIYEIPELISQDFRNIFRQLQAV